MLGPAGTCWHPSRLVLVQAERFPTSAGACRDVKVTESSESVLAGTKRPPFRLVVRAVFAPGEASPPVIQPTVSEEFVVSPTHAPQFQKFRAQKFRPAHRV